MGPAQRFPTSAKPASYNPIASAIECIDTSRIEDSTADGLLQEIRSKQNTQEYGIMCGILAIVLICLGVICLASPDARLLGYFLAPLGLGLLCYLPQVLWRDEVSRKVRIHYVLDPLVENIQESLERLLGALQRTEAVWSIKSDIRHGDWKRHAGATRSVDRHRIAVGFGVPANIETNAKVGSIESGTRKLYFFPDRILIFGAREVSAVAYDSLNVDWKTVRFVEDGYVPRDAKVVDKTWLYVNKDGGPDRRFSNNRQMPVALYGALLMDSGPGFRLNRSTQQGK